MCCWKDARWLQVNPQSEQESGNKGVRTWCCQVALSAMHLWCFMLPLTCLTASDLVAKVEAQIGHWFVFTSCHIKLTSWCAARRWDARARKFANAALHSSPSLGPSSCKKSQTKGLASSSCSGAASAVWCIHPLRSYSGGGAAELQKWARYSARSKAQNAAAKSGSRNSAQNNGRSALQASSSLPLSKQLSASKSAASCFAQGVEASVMRMSSLRRCRFIDSSRRVVPNIAAISWLCVVGFLTHLCARFSLLTLSSRSIGAIRQCAKTSALVFLAITSVPSADQVLAFPFIITLSFLH